MSCMRLKMIDRDPDPLKRLKKHASIRIYEDDRIEEIQHKLANMEIRINTMIRMLTKIGYLIEKEEKE